jgi:hypothetical protein
MTNVPTILDLIDAKQQLAALRRRDELRSANGLAAYVPHAKQDAFHRAGAFRSRYVRTGNRFGKSQMGAAEDCAWALGERPWYDKNDPARYVGLPKRSVKGVIIVADWKKAHEIFTNEAEGQAQGKLFQLLPRDSIVDVRRSHGEIAEVMVRSIHGGVSSIFLATVKSYKSNKLGSESADFDFIHVDEPCPEAMYKAFARGLVDRQGSEWFTCTPVFEMWINDKFDADGHFRSERNEPLIETVDIDGYEISTWMITGSMHDNPHLTGQAKAEFIAKLTEEERETRIDGRPAMLTGAIYKQFNPSDIRDGGHVHRMEPPRGWTDWHLPPNDWCIRIAIDTHPSTPHAVLFVATGPTGHSVFFNEIFDHPYMSGLVAQIFSRLQGRIPIRSLLELAAYNESPFEGSKTLAQEIVEAGLHNVEPAPKDLCYGILATQQALAKRDKDGYPFLSFCPALIRTIREFDRYVWNPETGKPVDKDDHMMENLYRLVISELTYVEPTGHVSPKFKETATFDPRRMVLPKNVQRTLPGYERKRRDNANRYPKYSRVAGPAGYGKGFMLRNPDGTERPYYIDSNFRR